MVQDYKVLMVQDHVVGSRIIWPWTISRGQNLTKSAAVNPHNYSQLAVATTVLRYMRATQLFRGIWMCSLQGSLLTTYDHYRNTCTDKPTQDVVISVTYISNNTNVGHWLSTALCKNYLRFDDHNTWLEIFTQFSIQTYDLNTYTDIQTHVVIWVSSVTLKKHQPNSTNDRPLVVRHM